MKLKRGDIDVWADAGDGWWQQMGSISFGCYQPPPSPSPAGPTPPRRNNPLSPLCGGCNCWKIGSSCNALKGVLYGWEPFPVDHPSNQDAESGVHSAHPTLSFSIPMQSSPVCAVQAWCLYRMADSSGLSQYNNNNYPDFLKCGLSLYL